MDKLRLNLQNRPADAFLDPHPIPLLDPALDIDADDRNIFFVETNSLVVSFNARMLCAVESAATLSPDHNVVVITVADTAMETVPLLAAAASNVRFRRIDLDQFLKESGVRIPREHIVALLILLEKVGNFY